MAAITVGVSFVGFWYLATHGKGTAPGRLVAWVLAPIIIWVFIAVNNPSAGAKVATFAATGTAGLIAGLGHFIAAL